MKFEHKVALVTGGAQGLGEAIALRLATEGADIAVNVRKHDDRSRSLNTRIEAMGRRCLVLPFDVSDVSEGRDALAEAWSELGPVDILVNNAGIERRAEFLDVTEKDYDLVQDINLKGAFFLAQSFARQCRDAKRGGRIINVSSVHEELPFPNFSPYGVSKGGMKMMMRGLAIELAPLGITVNNVAPGAIETPINSKLMNDPELLGALMDNIPLKRLGKPEDVAGVVSFLASGDADYVTGTTTVVDGGLLWNYAEQ